MGSDPGFGVASEVIRIVVEPNTFVIIGGTALGGHAQCLTILRETDAWPLIGLDNVLMYDSLASYLSFAPVNKTVAYVLLFEPLRQGPELGELEYARDFESTKHIVPNFATYYTIHTKNGSDSGCTLSVALIGATKGRAKSNGAEPGVGQWEVNSHPAMNPDEPEPVLEPTTPTGLRPFLLPFLLKNKYETSPPELRPWILKSRHKSSPTGLRPFILATKYKTWRMRLVQYIVITTDRARMTRVRPAVSEKVDQY
ncbi:hypothetical protein DFH07DRAFT_947282 [Mycena maculata]|uniref:Uncharacterized protein n=1 Tax=Mycena maculata TaxID=230809 RepID=A0AAD7MIZ6_9AGAR|nr:hypothetical protein DFH07DRAFT_947282 [Mycena maculata]